MKLHAKFGSPMLPYGLGQASTEEALVKTEQHFLLFPQCFLNIKERNQHFSDIKFVICKCFLFGYGPNFGVW